jgi:hypothetical protein
MLTRTDEIILTKIAFECYSPGAGLHEFLRRASVLCGDVETRRDLVVAYLDWLKKAFAFVEKRGDSPRCETASEVSRWLNAVRSEGDGIDKK